MSSASCSSGACTLICLVRTAAHVATLSSLICDAGTCCRSDRPKAACPLMEELQLVIWGVQDGVLPERSSLS